MVKAPATSPDNSKHYHYKVVTTDNVSRGTNLSGSGGGLPYHSQFHFQTTTNNTNKSTNNNKKTSVHRRVQMAEPPGSVSNAGPTLLVTTVPISVTSPQSGTPMIAVVAPTARNTNNANNNNNNNKSAHLKGNHSPIKATTSANLVHQQQPQQQQRLHPIPHIYHALPIQIPANLLASAQTQATNVWPTAIVEPAFHFGPGFERAANTSIMEIQHNQRQMTCPTHGTQNAQQPTVVNGNNGSQEHVVFFHVSPGVSVTFQIGNSREVVRGK